MNKKLFLGMIASTGLLCATSCSSDELLEPTSGDTVNVSFAISTDATVGSRASRAVADGMTAKVLYYSAVDQTNPGFGLSGTYHLINGKADVKLALLKGHEYKFAFWAQAEDAPYVVSTEDGIKVTIDYNGANNAENRDAFFANCEYTATIDGSKEVTLKRPFAQINVGTTEADYLNTAPSNSYPIKSTVTLKGSFGNVFDAMEGTVSGNVETITYEYAAIPNPDENTLKVADVDYKYLSTCYVLPATLTESQVVDAEFTFETFGQTVGLEQGLDALPIQSNYRTNIVGEILTRDANFKVEIDQNFDGEYNKNEENTDKPALSADGKTYCVSTAAQWAWLAAQGKIDKNIKLMADLDLAGVNVTPLYPTNVTEFILDGNGHTIKNATLSFGNQSKYQLGLLSLETINGKTSLTVKDLTLDGVTVDNKDQTVGVTGISGFAAALLGDVQNGSSVNIEGVTIKNSSIKGTQSVGSLVGFIAAGSTVTVSNTTVEGNTLSNYKYADESGFVCGLVGKVVGTLIIKDNVVVKNNTIDALFALKRGTNSIDAVAAARVQTALIHGLATVENNTITKTPLEANVTVIYTKDQLLDFAANYKAYNNKVVVLANDIDLAGVNWKPVGDSSVNYFGTFNGCGYTIENLTVNEGEGVLAGDGTAFIGWLGGTIENVLFVNATINGHHDVAVVVGYSIDQATISNCNVSNSKVTATYLNDDRGGDKAGALVGYNRGTIKDCHVNLAEVKAVRDAGQAIGCMAPETTYTNVKVQNSTVSYVGDADAAPSESSEYAKNGQNINNEIVGRK